MSIPFDKADDEMNTAPQNQTNTSEENLSLTQPMTTINTSRAGKQSSNPLVSGTKHADGKTGMMPGGAQQESLKQRECCGEANQENEHDPDGQFLFEKPAETVTEGRTTAFNENSKQDEIVMKALGDTKQDLGRAVAVEQEEVAEPTVVDDDSHREALTFSAIPAELRLAVYKLTWEPRRVPIHREWISPRPFKKLERRARRHLKQVDNYFDDTDITTVTTSSAALPVTLWVNAESREETLKHYQLSFARSRNGRSHVYFNFDLDELEIPRHCSLLEAIGRDELARVKWLSVPASDIQYPAFLESSTMVEMFSRISHDDPGITPERLKAMLKACRSGKQDDKVQKETHGIRDELIQTYKPQQSISNLCPSLERLDFRLITTCRCWSSSSSSSSSGQNECSTCALQHRWFADRFARVQVSSRSGEQPTPSYANVPAVYLDHNDPDTTIQEPNSNLFLNKTVVTNLVATPQAACDWPWCVVWSSIRGWYVTMMDVRQRFGQGASSEDGMWTEQLHEI